LLLLQRLLALQLAEFQFFFAEIPNPHSLSTHTHSFIHSLIHSFTHCFISFIHSLIHSFTHSFIHSFIHSLTHSFTHKLIHSFIHSLIHSFLSHSQSCTCNCSRSFLRLTYCSTPNISIRNIHCSDESLRCKRTNSETLKRSRKHKHDSCTGSDTPAALMNCNSSLPLLSHSLTHSQS